MKRLLLAARKDLKSLRSFIASRRTGKHLLNSLKQNEQFLNETQKYFNGQNSFSSLTDVKATIPPPLIVKDVPVDFGLSKVDMEIRKPSRGDLIKQKTRTSINHTPNRQTQINYSVYHQGKHLSGLWGLEDVAYRNESMEFFLSRTEPLEQQPAWKNRLLKFKANDGTEFKLAEPENDENVDGSMLYLSSLKMHLSKGMKTTTDFSKMLAQAADVSKGSRVLDLFFGLGYCSFASVNLGAEIVYGFEKFKEVEKLVRANPWSPRLNDERISYFNHDILEKSWIESFRHDEVVFSSGGIVAAYVPESGESPKFSAYTANVIDIFEKTGRFKFVGKFQNHPNILRFRRISLTNQ